MVFTPLIEACPFLYKFVLEFILDRCILFRKWQSVKIWPHQCLKVVEFVGFAGHIIDVELAMYLIKGPAKLEKITFDTRRASLKGTPWEFEETKYKNVARKRAEKFRTKLPAGAVLVII